MSSANGFANVGTVIVVVRPQRRGREAAGRARRQRHICAPRAATGGAVEIAALWADWSSAWTPDARRSKCRFASGFDGVSVVLF